MNQVSDSYVRRLCREGRIPGLLRVGRKTYLIPVGVAMRLKELGATIGTWGGQIRNRQVIGGI